MVFVAISANADDLKQGDKLIKSLELDFDEQAKSDDVFISWELSGDWDKFDYSFSQGTLEDNVFTIRANEYKGFANGHEGIVLTLEGKSKTDEGNYNLSMHVKDVTNDLDFPKDALNADFQINYILPPPPPLWKQLLVPFLIILALILVGFLVFHISAKFPDGLLQLGHDEIELKGRKKISVKKELEKIGRNVNTEMDVVLIRKRFVSYQGPTIKEMKGCELHRSDGSLLGTGDVIYPDETIYGLKDANDDDIIIRQC
jgi:hypothetical protein